MNVEKTLEGSIMNVKVSGRLDTTTAPELEGDVRPALEGVTELNLDLGDLEYISSAGLRVLLAFQKIMNEQGSMTVSNCNEMVTDVFEVTGFSEILTIK